MDVRNFTIYEVTNFFKALLFLFCLPRITNDSSPHVELGPFVNSVYIYWGFTMQEKLIIFVILEKDISLEKRNLKKD